MVSAGRDLDNRLVSLLEVGNDPRHRQQELQVRRNRRLQVAGDPGPGPAPVPGTSAIYSALAGTYPVSSPDRVTRT